MSARIPAASAPDMTPPSLNHVNRQPFSASLREAASRFCLILGSAILFQAFSILVLAALSFSVGLPLKRHVFSLACCAMGVFTWWTAGRYFQHHRLRVRLSLLILLTGAMGTGLRVTGQVYDTSWDGQTYHQETIIRLREGWNPFRDHLSSDGLPAPQQWNMRYIVHYARGAEILAASVYKRTGNIEHGKIFNLLLMLSSACLCLSALLRLPAVPIHTSLLLSAIMGANPVSLYQALTYYVDGQLSSLMVALLALGVLIIRSCDRIVLLSWLAGIVLLVNVKFTGVAYAGLATVSLVVCVLLRRQRGRAIRLSLLSAIAFVFGAGFIGFSPYITNTLSHANPIFPYYGSCGEEPTFNANMPANWRSMDRIDRLFHSVFSQTENVCAACDDPDRRDSHLKNPFRVFEKECDTVLVGPDIRAGGWGPLFGGAVVLSIALLLMTLAVQPRTAMVGLGIMLLVFLNAIVNPAVWWARLAPQLIAIPVIAVVMTAHAPGGALKIMGKLMILTLVTNAMIVGKSHVRAQIETSRCVKTQLAQFAGDGKPLAIDFRGFRSNRVRLKRSGITYREVSYVEASGPKPREHMIASETRIYQDSPLRR